MVLAEPVLSNVSISKWKMKITNMNDYVSVGIVEKDSAIKNKFIFKNWR